jgi:hypothetical protein
VQKLIHLEEQEFEPDTSVRHFRHVTEKPFQLSEVALPGMTKYEANSTPLTTGLALRGYKSKQTFSLDYLVLRLAMATTANCLK